MNEQSLRKPLSKEVRVHYEFMLGRLEDVAAYLKAGDHHMATAKLLADISRIKGVLGRSE